ncbi:hypothetical protein [Saccharopolyspora taberi]|uniref:Uncharacterized protein n=1 Tax=Saccharopolyspora taberi TaxID=60895 RepID=A0ABN3VKQ1_9PSEU
MDLIPDHRALFGVDVIGSASNAGYHLDDIPRAVEDMLSIALRSSGIDFSEVVHWERTGDGALLTLPSRDLGALLDAAQRLDLIAAQRNRRYNPVVRLRIAVEVGPVGAGPGYFQPKIAVNRLLDSAEFKQLVARCREEAPADAVNTALIVSDQVLRTVFGGDHVSLVRREEFAQLAVSNKEHADTAWTRIPGFDARTLGVFATPEPEPPAAPEPQAGQVTNVSYGPMNGVQTHTVHGGINFGSR